VAQAAVMLHYRRSAFCLYRNTCMLSFTPTTSIGCIWLYFLEFFNGLGSFFLSHQNGICSSVVTVYQASRDTFFEHFILWFHWNK